MGKVLETSPYSLEGVGAGSCYTADIGHALLISGDYSLSLVKCFENRKEDGNHVSVAGQ